MQQSAEGKTETAELNQIDDSKRPNFHCNRHKSMHHLPHHLTIHVLIM